MKANVIIAVTITCLTCFLSFDVLAGPNPDTGPGCGLGKLVWGDYKQYKNIAPQMMMATTNVTGSYWFAIASGTSGCTNDGKIMSEHRATMFAAANFDNLSQEMAQGHGEYLASLATLLGVPIEDQSDLFVLIQARHAELVSLATTSPAQMVRTLRATTIKSPLLAQLPHIP